MGNCFSSEVNAHKFRGFTFVKHIQYICNVPVAYHLIVIPEYQMTLFWHVSHISSRCTVFPFAFLLSCYKAFLCASYLQFSMEHLQYLGLID